ncbi:hypothetical protein J4461_02150 [Candidatus Pacearchaeota archaeon]|nr:hypothetical protein [Candidatus Pacearchaeota archaeon]
MVNPRMQGQPDYYLFVIDTDKYAGNFEREMCAYITGQIGECEVGKENAKLARQEIPDVVARLDELIDSVPDENGCHRPVSIFPTPGWFNNGMGGHFRDGQEEKALAHYKQETKKYYEKAPESYAENLREKVRVEGQQKIDEANALTVVQKYPAYMSIAIYFHSIPDRDLIDVIKQRARDIAAQGVGLRLFESQVRIDGFRFLEQYTTYKELNL